MVKFKVLYLSDTIYSNNFMTSDFEQSEGHVLKVEEEEANRICENKQNGHFLSFFFFFFFGKKMEL